MTSNGRTGQGSPLISDGMVVPDLIAARTLNSVSTTEEHRYWASGRRPVESPLREVMEVDLGSQRLLNYLSLSASRYPMVMSVEYLADDLRWEPLRHRSPTPPKGIPKRNLARGGEARLYCFESTPALVNLSTGASENPLHPSHSEHWIEEEWLLEPVRTSKVRVVIVRNPMGRGPVGVDGLPLPYSVAVKDLRLGYRIDSEADVPNTEGDWGSSKDPLGNPVAYSTYRQHPAKAVDGDLFTYWRSEPQPFPFAVVSMFLDMRDDDGTSPVIDRFRLDPITTGAHLNVYYAEKENRSTVVGLSTPIEPGSLTTVGEPTVQRDPNTSVAYAVDLTPGAKAGVRVSQRFTGMDYSQPWWVGIDARRLVPSSDADEHPMVSIGGTRIVADTNQIRVIGASGGEVTMPLPPELGPVNSRFTLVVSYVPATDDEGASFRIAYRLDGHERTSVQSGVVALSPSDLPVSVGLNPDDADTQTPALGVHGLVVKAEALDEETENWFIEEGEEFVSDSDIASAYRHANINALVRMHGHFVSAENEFGVVGGVEIDYKSMVWTPIPRDFTLRQGFLHVPPTRAAYWKFEMTNLIPEVYEVFTPIDRDVEVFPSAVIATHAQNAGGDTDNGSPSGVDTTGYMAQQVAYQDSLGRQSSNSSGDSSRVLVVRDPILSQQVAQTGWIWTYQPWHAGFGAPRFSQTQQHDYETLRISHSTKVAFFAAIREIEAYRVDYTFTDDTPEYVEHLLDTAYIDLTQTNGVIFDPEGGARSSATVGSITSVAFSSYRNVRGVQFASQESDSVQVLEDPDFIAEDLTRWSEFGDADIQRLGVNALLVRRGWTGNTYGDLEDLYGRPDGYRDMEDETYSELEGGQESGLPEGGVDSQSHTPIGAGVVTAKVIVSSLMDLSSPIVVEIISVASGLVLARGEKMLGAGDRAIISVSASGASREARQYEDLEAFDYEGLEEFTYIGLESTDGVSEPVFVRVKQEGSFTDSFIVHRVGLYDSPIGWFFSNDDGASWWQAVGVRNDPYSVLTFPEFVDSGDPAVGRTLRWQAKFYRSDAIITSLYIRPWYGVNGRTIAPASGLDSLGPNRSLRDLLPATHLHPMWQAFFNPIEHVYKPPPPAPWRNLALMPGGEENTPFSEGDIAEAFTAIGGTVSFVDPEEETP